VFLAVVILVIVGGAASIVMANQAAGQSELQALQKREQAYQQREEEYRLLIEQANQQLEQANTGLQAAQIQAATAVQEAAAPTSAMLSPGQAADIARQAVGSGQAELKQPELVSFEGQTAYEVAFEPGAVYVEALSGEILFNGTVPQAVDQEQAIQIAVDYFNEKDVVLADQITFRGAPLFRVVFKSRLMVYVDPTGQIVYAQYATLKSPPARGGSGAGSGHEGYDDHDEHEEDEHDD
jgi:hypothetical protein